MKKHYKTFLGFKGLGVLLIMNQTYADHEAYEWEDFFLIFSFVPNLFPSSSQWFPINNFPSFPMWGAW
jgi:hypothetical protein